MRGRDDLLETVAGAGARVGREADRLRGLAHDRARSREARRPRRGRRRAGPGQRARRAAARGEGRRRDRGDPPCGRAGRRGVSLARVRPRPRRAHRAARSPSRWSCGQRSSARTGLSFPPIVAAADNGALPHAEPRADPPIPRDTLVVVDFGVVSESYCSDCTRTFATGDVDAEAAECYELVRSAQAAALGGGARRSRRAGGGRRGARPDRGAGRGEQFGHGLGHGVGLEVHEAPRLAPSADGDARDGQRRDRRAGRLRPGPVRGAHRGPRGRRAPRARRS